ncbi:MAG: FUSC family protein, partial [Gammaproteobacteria bacterium]
MKAVTEHSGSRSIVGSLRGWWRAASNRITLGFALRGSVAMLVPFVVLLELGYPFGGVFAGLGGLNTVLVDSGGAYRGRFGAMLLAFVVGAVSLFVGARLPQSVWLAPVVLAVVAFAGGMARVFGGSGISIGLFASIMFLVGSLEPQGTLRAAEFAGFYALGGVWVVLFQLIVWRLRPYRALRQQIAACYGACAALVETLAAVPAGGDPGALRRRVRVRHQAAREAIRTAEATFDAVRLGAGHHSSPFFDRAALLLAAASREAVAATSLRAVDRPAPDTREGRLWRDLFVSWRAALAAVSQFMLEGRGEIPVAPMHAAFEALEKQAAIPDAARAPLRLALLHLDAVAEIGARISGMHFAWGEALPRLSVGGLREAVATLGAQLGFRSIIFRHALRVAVAAGFGLWVSGVFDVTHRLWLPMTTLIVLQPEFGATWRRLWQRIGGTLAGVLIAGGLHFLVHGNAAEIAVIAIFTFGTFFFIRGHYGVGVVMLTPMVLLLLGVLTPQAGARLIVARGVDTVLG